MNVIYIVIKIAAEKDGPLIAATTEKAFKDEKQAQAYIKSVPAVWEEVINGVECACERAIHPTELI